MSIPRALTKRYLSEATSEPFDRFVQACELPLQITPLTVTEFHSTLMLRLRMGDLDADYVERARSSDFKGGLNDWTIDKENTWEYVADGNINKGAYGGVQMTSFSACDGVMAFNSDVLDNGGVQGDFGAGLRPEACTGAVISPTIDLPGQNIQGIVVEFHQALRQFQSQYYLITSKDAGLTWPDTVQFNTEYPVNSNPISGERKRLALVGYAGVTPFRMKFEYVGNYYYWGIDDVVVINESKADIKVNENFYAAAPSLKTPASQVSEMPFLADISNIGNGNATNVSLDVIITDSQNAEIERFTNNYGNIDAVLFRNTSLSLQLTLLRPNPEGTTDHTLSPQRKIQAEPIIQPHSSLK